MKILSNIIFLAVIVMLIACGEGTVEVNDKNYQPKIVIEGYLYPNHPVAHIEISRNIPLNTKMTRQQLILSDAQVRITELEKNAEYQLVFDPQKASFHYPGSDLIIDYGKSYRIDATAQIDGKTLQASSVTQLPQKNFMIIDEQSTDSIHYHERDNGGDLKKPTITFRRSPGTDFYAFSIIALEADTSTFIYPPRNPYIFGNVKAKDVQENLYDLLYSNDEVFNTPKDEGVMSRELEWFHVMFFGRYRVIVYAGDLNMKNYYFTFKNVMEMDGNLHEPVFNIDGNGIGVFGSAITDTLYFNVLRD